MSRCLFPYSNLLRGIADPGHGPRAEPEGPVHTEEANGALGLPSPFSDLLALALLLWRFSIPWSLALDLSDQGLDINFCPFMMLIGVDAINVRALLDGSHH